MIKLCSKCRRVLERETTENICIVECKNYRGYGVCIREESR